MNISKKYKKLRPKPKLSRCTQKLWITENYRRSLIKIIPDWFKTQEMCVKAVDVNPYYIKYVPDCFITQEMIENGGRCYDSCCDSCNGELHEWFNGYNERKAQKAQIKAELLPIAWHPDRVIDWCFDEEEKKDLKRLWGSVEL